jgi:tetratricopeptide (TPR) repeat protein
MPQEEKMSRLVVVLTWGVATLVAGVGCAKKEATAPAAVDEGAASTEAAGGKIPVTTSSAEARAEFLQGRDLAEKLRVTDSIRHFQKAVSLDPAFALAEFSLATSAPTGKEFFEHLQKAVSLAGKVSRGERLLILATEAGANSNTAKQKEYLDQLVAAYPKDERASFNLGNYYFGRQDFPKAVEHYKRATELAPTSSSAFNALGYAYRSIADYANAEKVFQKYIELIPEDPNPYDSYAELLLKMGRFDESIAEYRKALSIDSNFVNAHLGIAMGLLYMGRPDEAAAELQTLNQKARTDAERRTAIFARTVVKIDGGRMAEALADVDEQYALSEKTNDIRAMALDRGLKGNVLLEMGKPDQARIEFEKGLRLIEGSNLSQEIRDNARLAMHVNLARVALAKKDFATARSEAEEFRKAAGVSANPVQAKLAHELDGVITLAEKNYDRAISELQQASLQDPYNLYRLCRAYQGKGDAARARHFCAQAAEFNDLPNMSYAFIRAKARAGAGKKG